MNAASIEVIVVVVPVHNEELLLQRCLDSLTRAVATVDRRCEVRIVLDACTDGSASIAALSALSTLEVAATAVGAARAAGISAALAACTSVDPQHVWIATTDADSQVPPQWLASQLALAESGTDVVIGTVRPDFDDLSRRHQDVWAKTHVAGQPNGHVHGANLGLRASTYLRAGGFSHVAEHEDVGLVAACRKTGAAVTASDDAQVLTSGRFEGRTPGGYAGYLRNQAAELACEKAEPDAQRTA
ncbi:glycosyltransferase (plasmid) [Coraliomargarita sp. W4R53]